ncbi:RNA-binding protein 34 [Synchiropus picturatus]
MKKKVQRSDETAAQQSCDYLVGQVSGSLFPKKSSGTLSSLFKTVAAAEPLRFQPAPEPVYVPPTEKQPEEPAKVKVETGKKKRPRVKSAAEQSLEKKEISLAAADEDEQASKVSGKKKKVSQQKEAGEACSVEQWVQKRQELRDRRREEAEKSKRTVFVGNLPLSCTKKTLLNLFRPSGPIESVRFRSVVREDPTMSLKLATIKRKTHPKKQSLNAYVVFKEESAVATAIKRNGTELEKDFHIRVDRVTAESKQHDHRRSVFVGNLSFEIKESVFRHHFEECGDIEAVRLVRDHNSGLGKGFGYILFESADSVQLALKLDGSKLEGRSIRVKRSVKKEKTKPEEKRRNKTSQRKGPTKGPVRGQETGRGALKKGRVAGKQLAAPSSFKGEMSDPNKKAKKKAVKKKKKPKKTIHI